MYTPKKSLVSELVLGALPSQHSHWSLSYFEKADARVTGERGEVLVIIKVDLTQTPSVSKLLSTPIKHPGTAQVPAWCGERVGSSE